MCVSYKLIYVFVLCRAVQHPRVPETQEFVRVHSYQSKMVIRPHKSFDEVCNRFQIIQIFQVYGNVSSFFKLSYILSCCFSLQNGFDYLLTYSDDPQTVFPRYCVSWMVSSGELLFFFKFIS